MGRKIPAKKHRGVKDPLQQQARRLQSIQSKINAPPRDPDEQPVPRSLTRLFQLPDPRKPKSPRNRHQRPIEKKGATGGKDAARGVRGLKRAPGESARDFSRRITGAVRALHDPLPEHYPGGEDDDEEGVEDKGARRRKRKQKQQQQKGEEQPADRQTRAQRRRQKMQLKKKEKQAASTAELREVQFERVPFGAVADAPPVLTAPRRAKAAAAAPRPGQRGLLLSAMLRAPAAAEAAERQRLAAVAAYRALKISRRGKTKTTS
ncbi:uncharacterized protein LOC113233847 [Hyposmocoma kahamanoa]|uniref:uncharacterized protein LOC113233847 n=1 Tax=Hyposmocoma kahamanoa TaxID=1477025 RepID=UPI000E6DA277|nr:uncharacterized protein LOC113233847 [Hyposmocoma kahamanoa]XP_026324852.1 uncharacterized protein LOC113233847 [Hyposmocoma kahamanoa]XP_026324853.1 uncharacterized protein LOC113233847 [Hyposmocoma kahamanoa]XP_026324854.1 uncharacterized protein LOC113233847 [Hyposmocoma kahamanoa]